MTTIKLFGGSFGGDSMFVRCNLAQASAPIQISSDGKEWSGTQYQCADTSHTNRGLIQIGKKLAAREVELSIEEFECEWEEVAAKRKISISGNWRKGGPINEWAGSGTVDEHGAIECSADLGEDAYDAIEEQIADGDESGSVTVRNDDQDRDITYEWEISD